MGLRGKAKKSGNQEKKIKLPYFIPIITKEKIVEIAESEDKFVTYALIDLVKEEYEEYFGKPYEGASISHDQEKH
jgi:hypothetical protein